jgi:hypothetical protein
MLLAMHAFGAIFIKAKKHIIENIRKNLEVIVDEICSWNKLQ